jgi:hypothetical protein
VARQSGRRPSAPLPRAPRNLGWRRGCAGRCVRGRLSITTARKTATVEPNSRVRPRYPQHRTSAAACFSLSVELQRITLPLQRISRRSRWKTGAKSDCTRRCTCSQQHHTRASLRMFARGGAAKRATRPTDRPSGVRSSGHVSTQFLAAQRDRSVEPTCAPLRSAPESRWKAKLQSAEMGLNRNR